MEYKRSDMYVQADQRKKGAWREKTKPMPPAEVELEFDLAVEVERAAKVETVAESCPVPPVIELPQDGDGCGYCITPVMSYTPIQKWGKLYEPEQALERGTIFPVLDYPFMGKGGKKA